jgi:hypothetical protein
MNTPIALIIFNRPSKTKIVFQQIAKAKPSKLFVIADGPRPDHPEDIEKCAEARAVVDYVDWNCEVFKNYSESNLGCGVRPASGISWVFEHVEEAIILEDDCAPSSSFFHFCEDLLQRYRHDQRIMMVGGTNTLFDQTPIHHSYFFSKVPACWGWATWRRAWEHYDMDLSLWPLLKDTNWLLDVLGDPLAASFWWKIFDTAYVNRKKVDYWDYQWAFACWVQNGLLILPRVNLVSNIGCDESGTHTKSPNNVFANLRAEEMRFPLLHPPYIIRNREADQIRFEQSPHAKKMQKPKLYSTLLNMLPDRLSDLLKRSIPRSLIQLIKPKLN